MAPLNPISTWNVRGIAGERKPRVHWFFVCEGSQTERLYFESLFELLDEKGLPVFAEGVYVNRTGKDKTASSPKKLMEQADAVVEDVGGNFGYEKDGDVVVIVFDADVFKGDEERYEAYLEEMKRKSYMAAVTNPSFGLYLLLHREGAYEKLVRPYAKEILENKKVSGARTFVDKHFSDNYGINPKTGRRIKDLAHEHNVARIEEQSLNGNPEEALGKLTSNIGIVIEQFKNAS